MRNFRVAVLDLEGASKASILGLSEMWAFANEMNSERAVGHIVQENICPAEFGAWLSPFDALVVPPMISRGAASGDEERILQWLRSQKDAGTIICSACGGAMVLGAAGLLDGRKATTHWSLSDEISRKFPKAEFDLSRILVDDGDLITAGGVMAWTQLGLRLVERFLGADIMLATAKFMLIDPADRSQSYYASFTPILSHGDPAIVAVQHALHQDLWKSATLDDLMKLARMSKRTFLRRFVRATGMTPLEYCQRIRIERSRELLERTAASIEQIAYQSGYEDQNSYRKIFKRELGVTPGEYRSRVALASIQSTKTFHHDRS